MKDWWKLLVSIIFVEAVGILSSLFTFNSIPKWYAALNKPFFNPPNWLFGPVWTVLYLMIGISFYLIWSSRAKEKIKNTAYCIFAIQLFLNFIWTIFFFGMHQILLALIVIVILWISIIVNILCFHKLSKASGYLLIPYLLWVTFASLLNFSLWILNY